MQAIVSKRGNSTENTLRVLQHIRRMALGLKADLGNSDFSVEGLRGCARTSNRGLVDATLMQKTASGHLSFLPQVADPSGG